MKGGAAPILSEAIEWAARDGAGPTRRRRLHNTDDMERSGARRGRGRSGIRGFAGGNREVSGSLRALPLGWRKAAVTWGKAPSPGTIRGLRGRLAQRGERCLHTAEAKAPKTLMK